MSRESEEKDADRGTSMKSQTVAQLLGTLGVTKTHSRPHTSDDNLFWESTEGLTERSCGA